MAHLYTPCARHRIGARSSSARERLPLRGDVLVSMATPVEPGTVVAHGAARRADREPRGEALDRAPAKVLDALMQPVGTAVVTQSRSRKGLFGWWAHEVRSPCANCPRGVSPVTGPARAARAADPGRGHRVRERPCRPRAARRRRRGRDARRVPAGHQTFGVGEAADRSRAVNTPDARSCAPPTSAPSTAGAWSAARTQSHDTLMRAGDVGVAAVIVAGRVRRRRCSGATSASARSRAGSSWASRSCSPRASAASRWLYAEAAASTPGARPR